MHTFCTKSHVNITMKGSSRSHTDLNWVYQYLKDGSYPPGLTISEKRIVRKRAETFCFTNNELYFVGTPKIREAKPEPRRVILKNEEKWKLIEEVHIDEQGGHLGLEKSMELLDDKYYWVGMSKFVRDYIRQCKRCKEKHPCMVKPTMLNIDKEEVEEEEDNAASTSEFRKEDSFDEISTMTDEGSSVCEVSSLPDEEVTIRDPARAFWHKVDLRLFGPFQFGKDQKYILSAVDVFSCWPEMFVLDNLSPASVAHCLLKLICRYGQMEELVMSQNDVALEMGLVTALDVLKLQGSLDIRLTKGSAANFSDVTYMELDDLIRDFVSNNPTSWPHCVEFCLLPVRVSCSDRAEYSPAYLAHGREPSFPKSLLSKPGMMMECRLSPSEKSATIQKLMAMHKLYSADFSKTLVSDETFLSPGPSTSTPLTGSPVRGQRTTGRLQVHERVSQVTTQTPDQTTVGRGGMTTRSKTGHSKFKLPDPETYEVSSPVGKRRLSQMSASDQAVSAVVKRIKIEVKSDDEEGSGDESESDVSEVSKRGRQSIGMMDLDNYYEAIKMYVTKAEYPPNKSRGFKRVIRGAAKHYTCEDGKLYHSTGIRTQKKRIIEKKEDRFALLKDVHIAENGCHLSKHKVFEKLSPVHWRGLTLDCEAFIMACPDCANGDVKTKLQSHRTRGKDITDKEELRDLKKDRQSMYRNLGQYLQTGEFAAGMNKELEEDIETECHKFKVQDNQLFHLEGKKTQLIVTSAEERREIISKVHNEKGKHLDVRSVLKTILEQYFWYGMKVDVIQFISLCCESVRTEKLSPERKLQRLHVQQKYFMFRELLMQDDGQRFRDIEKATNLRNLLQAVLEQAEAERENSEQEKEVSETLTLMEDIVATETEENTGDTEKTEKPETVDKCAVVDEVEERPTGIFVASESVEKTPSSAVESTDDTTELASYEVSVMLDSPITNRPEEESKPQPEATDDAIKGTSISVSTMTVEGSQSSAAKTPQKTKTVIVKLNAKGQAVVVEKPEHSNIIPKKIEGHRHSDPVTVAAVKSILPGDLAAAADCSKSDIIDSDDEDLEEEEAEALMEEEEEEEEEEDSKLALSEINSESSFEISTTPHKSAETEFLKYMSVNEGVDEKIRTPTPRPAFKCHLCNKVMYGPIKFKMHMYRHTGQKPFGCEECGKRYTNNKSLTIHMRIHTGELPYLCNLCGKRTASKISLKSHLKTHAKGGGMPAECDICGRAFARRHLMERHKHFKHTNLQTQFKCTECAKVFGHQRSLKRHFMSHHVGVKNHVCDLCGKAFFRKEYLNSHLAQHGTGGEKALRKSRLPASAYIRKTRVIKQVESEEEDSNLDQQGTEMVQRIVLQQDASGNLRVVDPAMAQEVKRILANQGSNIGETMVVIEGTGDGDQGTVVHLENPDQSQHTLLQVEPGTDQSVGQEVGQEQVLHVPIESQSFIVDSQELEYQQASTTGGASQSPIYVATNPTATSSTASNVLSFTYAPAGSSGEGQVNQELIYGQPAVQYEVECVGDVGDEEALSAINLLAQASAAQYENVVVSNS